MRKFMVLNLLSAVFCCAEGIQVFDNILQWLMVNLLAEAKPSAAATFGQDKVLSHLRWTAKEETYLNGPLVLVTRDIALANRLLFRQHATWLHNPRQSEKPLQLGKMAGNDSDAVLERLFNHYRKQLSYLPVNTAHVFWGKIRTRGYGYLNAFVYEDTMDLNSLDRSKAYVKGRTLIATAYEMLPATWVTRDRISGEIISMNGLTIDILNVVSKNLEFNYNLTVPAVSANSVGITWVVDKLIGKEVDMIIVPMTLSAKRFKVLEYSYAYYISPSTILIPYPTEKPSALISFRPLQLTLWICYIAAVFVISVLLFIIAKLRVKVSSSPEITLANSLMFTFGIITNQGEEFRCSKLKTRWLIGSWCLSCVILVNAYTSMLISYLTAPQLYPVVDSIEDLAQKNELRPVVIAESVLLGSILQATSGTYKALGDKIRTDIGKHTAKSYAEGITKVLTGEYAFILNELSLRYYGNLEFRKTRQCQLTLTRHPFAYGTATWTYRKNAPFRKAIDTKLFQLNEGGIIEHVVRHGSISLTEFTDHCKFPSKNLSPLIILTKDQLLSSFVVLATGYSAAFIVFIFELAHRRSPRNI